MLALITNLILSFNLAHPKIASNSLTFTTGSPTGVFEISVKSDS